MILRVKTSRPSRVHSGRDFDTVSRQAPKVGAVRANQVDVALEIRRVLRECDRGSVRRPARPKRLAVHGHELVEIRPVYVHHEQGAVSARSDVPAAEDQPRAIRRPRRAVIGAGVTLASARQSRVLDLRRIRRLEFGHLARLKIHDGNDRLVCPRIALHGPHQREPGAIRREGVAVARRGQPTQGFEWQRLENRAGWVGQPQSGGVFVKQSRPVGRPRDRSLVAGVVREQLMRIGAIRVRYPNSRTVSRDLIDVKADGSGGAISGDGVMRNELHIGDQARGSRNH